MTEDKRHELRGFLEERFSGIDQRLEQASVESGQLKAQFQEMGARFDQTDARIDRKIEEVLCIGDQHARETRDFILAQSADVKRHFDMVAERVEEGLKKVVEGYEVLAKRVDGLCREP
jgi:hypothetical protein